MQNLQCVSFHSPLPTPVSVMEEVPSEGRYCSACRHGFSLLDLGWKEAAETDVPYMKCLNCVFVIVLFFPLLMGGGEWGMFSVCGAEDLKAQHILLFELGARQKEKQPLWGVV